LVAIYFKFLRETEQFGGCQIGFSFRIERKMVTQDKAVAAD